jgi:hypothetical protein
MKYFVHSAALKAQETKNEEQKIQNGTEIEKKDRVKFANSRTSVSVQCILPHRAHLVRELI